MDIKPDKPGYAALRRFRESKPGSLYFITTNLADRGSGLELSDQTELVFRQWQEIEAAGFWSVRSAVVMPDHIHLLTGLGDNIALAEALRLFKGRLTPSLRRNGLKWQEGFYDHLIRESEDLLPVFLYIYLNPYRANLISAEQSWPGYFCHPDDWAWLGNLTRESRPQPEWLR